MDLELLKEKLNLKPLSIEGGFFCETYKSDCIIDIDGFNGKRAVSTAIYYLLTPDTFSAIHRVKSDEVFHFYLGDKVEMLILSPDGTFETVVLGNDIFNDEKPQYVVRKDFWQGCRLVDGGEFALMGTTVAPGFEYDDFELGDKGFLMSKYPEVVSLLSKLVK